MQDISLAWNQQLMAFDVVMQTSEQGTDLQGDDGLLTAIMVSLFTDRRAKADDPLPDERVGQPSDLRGWWGDYLTQEGESILIGSRLWLLHREKEMPVVVARAREYAQEALQWLLNGGYVKQLSVQAHHVSRGYLGISVQALQPNGNILTAPEWLFTYDYINAQPVSITANGL